MKGKLISCKLPLLARFSKPCHSILQQRSTDHRSESERRGSINHIIVLVVIFMMPALQDLSAQKFRQLLTIKSHSITLLDQEQALEISTDCPFISLDNQILGGYSPVGRFGQIQTSAQTPFRITYAPIHLNGEVKMDAELFIQWFPKEKLLRKWVRFRLSGIKKPVLLKEIILDRIESKGSSIGLQTEPGQNYPAFLPGFFVGIEYPVSSVRLESGQIVLAHQPGIKIQSGKWYESRKAVYCATQKGYEKEAFHSYIAANQPKNDGIHVNYNSWWTSPMPYSEKNILDLMKTFEEKMFIPYGVSFNTFCIDMGWSNPKSIWGIDTLLFPKKFNTIREAAKKMNSNLGLWISPSNLYSPKSLDSRWAEEQGYETYIIDSTRMFGNGTLCCLGGEHYYTAFREQLVDLVKRYEIMQLKFDGYIFTANPSLLCYETDHGHEPGYLSIEPIAVALIETCRQVHSASPGTWIETTCMGGNPSPWWLFYVNSVIGNYGSDTPVGRIPCPIYRESYTSARDFLNIQGATYGLTPISSQEVLGIIHQSPEPFDNDAVTTIMRGNLFLPLYINPAFMDGPRWRMISDMITWAKNNASLIRNTKVLLPQSWQNGNVPRFKTDASTMPYEPYGYSHCIKNKGLIELRNPWIKKNEYLLKIDSSTGFSKSAKNLNMVSLYPEVRIYARDLKYGDTVKIPLAPYETLVVSVSTGETLKGLPDAVNSFKGFGKVIINKIEKTVIKDAELNNAANQGSTLENQKKASKVRLNMEGSVEVTSLQADLLVLFEGNTETLAPDGKVNINGEPAELSVSEIGGKGRFQINRKLWIFLKAPLKQGKNSISLTLNLPASTLKVSVWAWAKKPGNTTPPLYPNALPRPEDISLESVNLIEPFITNTISKTL